MKRTPVEILPIDRAPSLIELSQVLDRKLHAELVVRPAPPARLVVVPWVSSGTGLEEIVHIDEQRGVSLERLRRVRRHPMIILSARHSRRHSCSVLLFR